MRVSAILIAPLLSLLSLHPVHATAQSNASPTPISSAEYAARRDSLLERLGDGATVVAFGERAPIGFPAFYQVPAFRYLTGFLEPEAALLLARRGGVTTAILFREPRSARDVIMDGAPEDSAALAARTGLSLRPLAALPAAVDSVLATGTAMYTLRDVRPYGGSVDSLTRGGAFEAALRRRTPSPALRSADEQLDSLRARKSAAEHALLRRAAEVTSASLRETIARIRPGMHEYEIQASIEAGFRSRGADRPGFATNVSAGANATIVHHRAADDVAESGELVLMDVGAAWQGYTADVTRTVPVSGRFTPAQRSVYQLVRDAQAAAERLARPGASMRELNDTARAVIARGLVKLGLIEAEDASFDPPWVASCTLSPGACRQSALFYSHGLGHGIGLEVHDPAHAPGPAGPTLAVADAFTIEPGVYVSRLRLELLPDTPRNRAFVARVRDAVVRHHGIGVRIEDDYLVTRRGVERITTTPRDVDEIELLMRRTPR
ncbi:MAG TPA: Xaa-Pro aminopeptidase [Gemmatimonadaceae bacterium]|nr:Xaa-Pro aminopeptidase [Gemmatimonadaceae bacterium]